MSTATHQAAGKKAPKQVEQQVDQITQHVLEAGPAPLKPVTTERIVKMLDGREVIFTGKRKIVKETWIDVEAGTVRCRLNFSNGEAREKTIHKDDVMADGTPAMYRYAAHGLEQKSGDETAGIEDVDDQVVAVEELYDRLNAGEWTQRRDASGMAGASILIRALVEWSGKQVDTMKAFLKPKSGNERTALRDSERPNKDGVTLKSIVARMEAEKAAKAKKVDTSVMLDELDKLPG